MLLSQWDPSRRERCVYYLSAELRARLRAASRDTGLAQSEIVRRALHGVLSDGASGPGPGAMVDAAVGAAVEGELMTILHDRILHSHLGPWTCWVCNVCRLVTWWRWLRYRAMVTLGLCKPFDPFDLHTLRSLRDNPPEVPPQWRDVLKDRD